MPVFQSLLPTQIGMALIQWGRMTTLLAWLLWMVAGPASVYATETGSRTTVPPLVLDASQNHVPLAQRSLFWVDPTGRLTAQEVAQQQDSLPFAVRNPKHRLLIGPQAVLWLRFDAWIKDSSADWEAELTQSGIDLVSFYYQHPNGDWHAQHAGDSIPVKDWALPGRYPVFALDKKADQPTTYWIRIQHARMPFSGEFFVHRHSHLREKHNTQQFMLGGFFGMTLLLTVVAVVNGLVYRDLSFAAYAVYIGVLGLELAAALGIGGQFLWPHSARWNGLAEFILLPLVAVTGLLFVRQVVQPSRIGRWLDRLSITLIIVLLALTAWDVFYPSHETLQALTTAGALTLVLIYAMLWAAWRTGERWVCWIALGSLPVLMAGTLPILRNFGLMSSGFLSQYGMVIAAAIEAPLLIYALLQRSSMQHEAQTRAQALALTEPLTGLTNRHNGMLRLHESLVRAQRYKHSIALLLIDLDNHAWFEEEHGREVADRALVLTGSLLRSIARDVDTAARIDNSSFMFLMEGPVRAAQAVAAATSIVAGGLRPSYQLPVGATLRFKVVVALIPKEELELQQDARAHLEWMRINLDELRKDKRRSIQTINV